MIEPATLLQVTDHRARWKWFIALGVILLVLGITGISVATLLQFTSLLVCSARRCWPVASSSS